MNVKHCQGCEQNFYNGNNDLGVKECWMLKEAKRARFVLIHMDEMPPHRGKAEWLPTCYQKIRFVKVSSDRLKGGYIR